MHLLEYTAWKVSVFGVILVRIFPYSDTFHVVISSVAHHNPHVSVFVVYLVIQELFVDKIHLLKCISVSDKLWLDQLKIIAATRGANFSESFHMYKEGKIPARKGKHPVLRTNAKREELFKHTIILYSIASLVFR